MAREPAGTERAANDMSAAEGDSADDAKDHSSGRLTGKTLDSDWGGGTHGGSSVCKGGGVCGEKQWVGVGRVNRGCRLEIGRRPTPSAFREN